MYHDFHAERNEDTLYGTAAIARFLGVPRRKAFYLIERGRIPAGKLGRENIGSKSALRQHLANLTRGDASSELQSKPAIADGPHPSSRPSDRPDRSRNTRSSGSERPRR